MLRRVMAGTHLFTWLHLSDIHIGHGGASHEADQRLVLGALRDDVAKQIAAGLPRPDVILVTGDIAFSGACVAKDEYERAAQWLGEIAKAAGVPLEAVYAVPGNHDVQRPVDRSLQAKLTLKGLRSGEVTVDDALVDDDTRAHLAKRQSNYLAFVEQLAHACRAKGESKEPRLYWTHTLAADGGLKVRLVGLNTALLAADENAFGPDLHALRLGKRQLADALAEPVGAHEVVLVLSHHPFGDGWLRDEADADTWTRNHAHIHLSGHVHSAATSDTRSGAGGAFVRIVAGATHGEREPEGVLPRHGYSFGALLAIGGKLHVRVWPRTWSQRNAGFRRDTDVADEQTGFATHELPRVALPTPASGREHDAEPPGGSSRPTTGPSAPEPRPPAPSIPPPPTYPPLGRLDVLIDRARKHIQVGYRSSVFTVSLTLVGSSAAWFYHLHRPVRIVGPIHHIIRDAGCGDILTDPANCGACGRRCPSGQGCFGGACESPTISVNSPNSESAFAQGGTFTAAWTASNITGYVRVVIRRYGTEIATATITGAPIASQSITVPNSWAPGGGYDVCASANSTIGTVTDCRTFSVTSPTPTIAMTSPSSGGSFARRDTFTAAWTASNITGYVRVIIRRDDGRELAVVTTTGAASASQSITVPSSLAPGSRYHLCTSANSSIGVITDCHTFSVR